MEIKGISKFAFTFLCTFKSFYVHGIYADTNGHAIFEALKEVAAFDYFSTNQLARDAKKLWLNGFLINAIVIAI